ncbi:hypothetical protein TNCV_189211 [Trichonephila clavipes]|nr:hypothetical protein TNCV_189211 [Trichonephila clavipes]
MSSLKGLPLALCSSLERGCHLFVKKSSLVMRRYSLERHLFCLTIVLRSATCTLSVEIAGCALDTLRENCGIIRKQASIDGGVLWKVTCVDVVQVRRKNRSLRDPREARYRVRI